MSAIMRSTRSALPSRTTRSVAARPLPSRVFLKRAAVVQPKFVVRAEGESSVDTDKLISDLKAKFDAIENKPQAALYTVGAVFALWLASSVVSAVNHVPLFPKVFEFIGLSYSGWFTYRYLLFKSSREELIKDVDALKTKITGSSE